MIPGLSGAVCCSVTNPVATSTMSGNWGEIFDSGNNSITATNSNVAPGAGTIWISDFSGTTPEGSGSIKIYKNDVNQGVAWQWIGDTPVDLGLTVSVGVFDNIRFVANHVHPEEVVSFTATVSGNDGAVTAVLDTFLVILTTT